jgi:serine phosphatase RsbU (regulator of sigma subunit)
MKEGIKYRDLFKKVEKHLGAIEEQESLKETLGLIIEDLLEDFAENFGFTGARLYVLDEGDYRLEKKFGDDIPAPIGYVIPSGYEPIKALRRCGCIFMDRDSKDVDPLLEEKLGAERFTAISVGHQNAYIIAFTVRKEFASQHDDILFALSSIRHAINLKLAKDNLESIVLQSQEIQLSLLPEKDPVFEGFDISGRSIPAQIVGGDVYDFLWVSPKILGIAIGDATGHGLPAALQARDALIGLRMGIHEDQKIVKVFEKLNKVIHRSRLTSRYVSLFYMELETSGQIVYINAGHVYPFHYRKRKDRFVTMAEGGIVLGPTSQATYGRGFVEMEPGDCIIGFSDGITEAKGVNGEDYGEDRVKEFLLKHYDEYNAGQMVDRLLDEVALWSVDSDYTDDRTVIFVRRKN